MSSLDSLIRLHGWRLEEKRRVLADLETLMDELKRRARDLEAEIRNEQSAAAGSDEAAYAYGAYAAEAINRREKLAQSVVEIGSKIELARDGVRAAFQEVNRDLRRKNVRIFCQYAVMATTAPERVAIIT